MSSARRSKKTKVSDGQIRAILKARRVVRWVYRVVGAVGFVLASSFLVTSLTEMLKAHHSPGWPSVTGRIVSSEVAVASQSEHGQQRTAFRAVITYAYQVDGNDFQDVRVAFGGYGNSAGTIASYDESAARADADRFPPSAPVKVYYNPRNSGDAVLEPGASHMNRSGLIASIVSLAGAIVFLLVFRVLISRFFRGVMVQQAEMYGPGVWDVAGEYGLTPPPSREVEAAESQPTIDLPFEAKQRVALEGGQSVSLEFSGCLIHTTGDFVGRLEVAVRSSPPLPAEAIVENLRLRISEHDQLLDVGDFSDLSNLCEVAFHLADLAPSDVDDMPGWERDTAQGLRSVELWWGEADPQRLATVSSTHVTEP